MLKMWDQPLFCNQKPREPDRISGSFSGALSQNTQSLKITKTFQKKANNICWEKSKPLGGGGLDGILNPSSPPPPNHPRTKELKRILVSSRVTNKVEIDDVSQTLSTFLTGMNFPNYLASLEKSSE